MFSPLLSFPPPLFFSDSWPIRDVMSAIAKISGQQTEHVHEHCQISREHSRGSLRGDPLLRFAHKTSTFVGIFVDIFVYTPMCIFVGTGIEPVKKHPHAPLQSQPYPRSSPCFSCRCVPGEDICSGMGGPVGPGPGIVL